MSVIVSNKQYIYTISSLVVIMRRSMIYNYCNMSIFLLDWEYCPQYRIIIIGNAGELQH